MFACPACGVTAFDQGRCRHCQYVDPRLATVRVVSGTAVAPPVAEAAPPVILDASALFAVEDAGPSLPGFESTSLDASAPRRRPARRSTDKEETETKSCQDCGSENPLERTICMNCGFPLRSSE